MIQATYSLYGINSQQFVYFNVPLPQINPNTNRVYLDFTDLMADVYNLTLNLASEDLIQVNFKVVSNSTVLSSEYTKAEIIPMIGEFYVGDNF